MKILVFSKELCRLNHKNILVNKIPTICIMGVTDKDHIFADSHDSFSEHKEHVLNVFFDDVIEGDPVSVGFMTMENAVEILKFVEKHSTTDIMIVHCFAGICRSGAVGKFINNIMNKENAQDSQYFDMNNGQINPNPFVEKMLNRVYEKFEWDI